MKFHVRNNIRLIVFIILGLVFVFLVPLQFGLYTSTDSTSYFIFNTVFYIQTDSGTVSHTLFRWMLTRYPLSIVLVLTSLVFTLRLQQLDVTCETKKRIVINTGEIRMHKRFPFQVNFQFF